jgi:uncharacterized protein (TIGR02594 family)
MRMIVKSVIVASFTLALLTTAASARPFHKHRAAPRAQHTIECNQQGCSDTQTLRAKAAPRDGTGIGPSFTTSSLVNEAKRYMGTNPTGRASQWCGAFMDLVLRKTGHKPGSNLARAYKDYGTRVSGPQVGAIAVMNHHVGVVSGVDPNGNPIIVSGNHNRTVAESVYPRSRIIAYMMPN